jgi:peptidyl-prolyl cis-trans isomerase D
MITFIRSLVSSKFGAFFALLFVGIIAVGFVLGDVTGNSSFGGLNGGNVAKVGGEPITIGDFNTSLQNNLEQQQQELQDPTLDMQRFVALGGFDMTLTNVIGRLARSVYGDQYGVAVSKRLIDYEILKLPGVKGLDGKFSKEGFNIFLQESRTSESFIRNFFAQVLFDQQFKPVSALGLQAPNAVALQYASMLLEKRNGQVALIPSEAFLPSTGPNDAELAKYYKNNAAKFTIPEKRVIIYAVFDRSIAAGKATPTPEDIAAYYKANAANYAASETRNVKALIVPTQAGAAAVADKLKAGQPIDAAAKSLGIAVINLQNQNKAALAKATSAAAADAVFAAGKGQVTAPAKGPLGFYVAQVESVMAVPARSLAEATPEIAKKMAVEKEEEAVANVTKEIEEALSNGESLKDVAAANGLTIQTTAKLFANGQDAANPAFKASDELKAILSQAFQLDEDGEPQLIELAQGQKFAVISVANLEKAAAPPLANVKPAVLQSWMIEKGYDKAKAAAEQVQKLVSSGKSLNEALASLKIKTPALQSIGAARSELRQQGSRLPQPVVMLFSMKQGTAKTAKAPNNAGWFVVKLDQVVKGDASKNSGIILQTKNELSLLMQAELDAQFVLASAKAVSVKKNDGAISSLRASYLKKNDGN